RKSWNCGRIDFRDHGRNTTLQMTPLLLRVHCGGDVQPGVPLDNEWWGVRMYLGAIKERRNRIGLLARAGPRNDLARWPQARGLQNELPCACVVVFDAFDIEPIVGLAQAADKKLNVDLGRRRHEQSD